MHTADAAAVQATSTQASSVQAAHAQTDTGAPVATRPVALAVSGLGKRVPLPSSELTILEGVGFDIDRGDTVAIVGASGSGKSTLLALMAGLDTPSSGRVVLDGEALSSLDEDGRARVRGEKIGFVFQSFQLLPSLTALENVMVPLELRGDADAEPRRAILSERGPGRAPVPVPGATVRRRTTAGRPGARIRDAAVAVFRRRTDRQSRYPDRPGMIEKLFDLNAEAGTTLVLVTHDEHLAVRCTHVAPGWRPAGGHVNVARLAWRQLRRDLKAGDIRILLAALTLAVVAVTAVGFVTDRAERALAIEANRLLGGDAVVRGDAPIAGRVRTAANAPGLHRTETVELDSMIRVGEGADASLKLGELRALGTGFPLRGRFRIAGLDAIERDTSTIPQPGTAWMSRAGADTLGASVGEVVAIGDARLRLAALVLQEPDASLDYFNVAPKVFLNLADLPATGLVQQGSRIRYRLVIAGECQRG